MEVIYSQRALDDLKFWKTSGNITIQKKISALLDAIEINPFIGVGKPEALKFELTGKWSRRINQEHRIVYDVADNIIRIYSLKGHY